MAPPQWAYQVDNFDPPPDEELVCSICRAIFCEPVQCPCNHVFCRVCISKWLQSSRNCPICRKRATRYSIQDVVPLIKNMILKLTLRCRNSENGCEEKFTLEGCEIHMKDCVFEMIQCKNKPCKKKFFRKDIADHELNDCPHRYVRCKMCRVKISSLSPINHNCVEELKKMVKKRDATIQKKENEILILQRQINMLNESNRRLSDTSSLASISTADIMISLADVPSLSSDSSDDSISLFSDVGHNSDSPPRWSDDDSQVATTTQDGPNSETIGSVATQYRNNNAESQGLRAVTIYLDRDSVEIAQSATPAEVDRSRNVELRNNSGSQPVNPLAMYFEDQSSIENARSSSPPEVHRPHNIGFRNIPSALETFLEDDSYEIPHSSTSAAEADSSVMEVPESSFDETFQPRRPAKRRYMPDLLNTSDDADNGAAEEIPSIPSPKRCWRLYLREASHPTSESSSLSSSQVDNTSMEAGPSFLSSAAKSGRTRGVKTRSYYKNKLNRYSSGDAAETSLASCSLLGARKCGEAFERTITMLQQYNLDSDPEWLPEYASHTGDTTTSESDALTSSEESDSSDSSYLDTEISTADLLRRCFGDDDDDDDDDDDEDEEDDPEWEPIQKF